jgi:hypothetical protein
MFQEPRKPAGRPVGVVSAADGPGSGLGAMLGGRAEGVAGSDMGGEDDHEAEGVAGAVAAVCPVSPEQAARDPAATARATA